MADEYGHATVNDAIALAVRAKVESRVLTDHAPTRTDDELDLLAATVSAPMPVTVAAQGDVLEVNR
jgi:ribonuclease BN (tRNA processing enzyme)